MRGTTTGRLRHEITIQRKTEPQDESGFPVETWTTYATVWASIVPLGGSEVQRGLQVEAGVTTIVKMRLNEGVTPGMRIVHGSRTLNIVSAYDPDGRRASTWCQCKEVASG